jgi:hypothetical protein
MVSLPHPEKKRQSMQWNCNGIPMPKKFQRVASAGKQMAMVLWSIEGILMLEWLKQCHLLQHPHTPSSEIQQWLKDKRTQKVLVVHDNSRPHTSHQTT